MLARFPRLSKLAIKILEITGAACASTFAAVLLGNSREPPRPPAPPVVQLAPADAQMIRTVREESVALAEQLRSASDTRSTAPAAAATLAGTTAKPAKAAASVPAHKEQKAARMASESKQRPAEPPPVHSETAAPEWEPARVPPPAWELAPVPPAAAAGDARDGRLAATAAAPAETGLPATPASVPSRLWPAAASSPPNAPRPPLGVGQYLSSSM